MNMQIGNIPSSVPVPVLKQCNNMAKHYPNIYIGYIYL